MTQPYRAAVDRVSGAMSRPSALAPIDTPDGAASAPSSGFRAAAAAALACSLFIWACIAFQVGGRTIANRIDEISEGVAALVCAAVCLGAAARRADRLRRAWGCFGVAGAAWAAGEAIWTWYDFARHRNPPSPSFADVGFLLAIPCFLLGTLVLSSTVGPLLTRLRTVLDGLIIATSLLVVGWGTVLDTVFHRAHTGHLAEAIAIAYPVGDLTVAALAISAILRAARRYRAQLGLVVAGFVTFSVADSAFLYVGNSSPSPLVDSIDAGWVVGFLAFALAALLPEGDEKGLARRVSSGWRLLLPYLFLAGSALYVAGRVLADHRLDPSLGALGVLVLLAVLARQMFTVLEEARRTSRLEQQAKLDPLTGVANRLLFAERLTAVGDRHPAGSKLGLLLVDLDDFKAVNDTLGHAVGDEVLVGLVRRLQRAVRSADLVARLGGDEFAVILEPDTDVEAAVRVSQRVLDAMAEPLETSSELLPQRVSVGIAVGSCGPGKGDELLRDADVALYAAKRAGGNCFRTYGDELGAARSEQLRLHAEFAAALARGEFVTLFEPVIALDSDAVVGVNALLRWEHPTRGLLAAADFAELLERSPETLEITRWMLDLSLAQLAHWTGDRHIVPRGSWVNIRISSREVLQRLGADEVGALLGRYHLGTDALRFEIPENALSGISATPFVEAMNAAGIGLVIDEFGSGHASLHRLRRSTAAILKLDRRFVDDLERGSYDAIVVGALSDLAHARDIRVLLGGIDSARHLALARELRCDFGTGPLFSEPVQAEELGRWIEQRLVARATPSIEGAGER